MSEPKQVVKIYFLCNKLNDLKIGFNSLTKEYNSTFELNQVYFCQAQIKNTNIKGYHFKTSKWELNLARNWKLTIFEKLVKDLNHNILKFVLTRDPDTDFFFLEVLELLIQSINVWFTLPSIVSLVSAMLSNLHLILCFAQDLKTDFLKEIWSKHSSLIDTFNFQFDDIFDFNNTMPICGPIRYLKLNIVSKVTLKTTYYKPEKNIPVEWCKTHVIPLKELEEQSFLKCNYTLEEFTYLQDVIFVKNIKNMKSLLKNIIPLTNDSKDFRLKHSKAMHISSELKNCDNTSEIKNEALLYINYKKTIVPTDKVFLNILDKVVTYTSSPKILAHYTPDLLFKSHMILPKPQQ